MACTITELVRWSAVTVTGSIPRRVRLRVREYICVSCWATSTASANSSLICLVSRLAAVSTSSWAMMSSTRFMFSSLAVTTSEPVVYSGVALT